MTTASSTRPHSVALPLWPLVAAICLLAALVWTGSLETVAPMLNVIASAASEPNFYGSALAGLGLLAGGTVAHWLQAKQRPWQGFGQACGSGLWVPMLASALLGVAISNLAWGWTLAGGSWQPLFVPFVSVSPTVVLMFGADARTVLTGGVLGGLLTPPLSVLGADVICPWLGVPPVVGVTGGMAVGAVIAFTVCRHLPWLPAPLHLRHNPDAHEVPVVEKHGPTWLLRRSLADFSEAQFFGSEWASFGLILGVVVTYVLNPALPAYGSGLLWHILAAQALTAIIGVVLWRGQWARRPFYPTFVPVVSVAPACVLAYGGTTASIVAGAVLGAATSPPLAAAISSRLPTDFHPFIGNVAAMAIATSVIVPPLQLLPGI
jgi:MFS transporter, ENTS family, enterobactin (siderophore) exporter